MNVIVRHGLPLLAGAAGVFAGYNAVETLTDDLFGGPEAIEAYTPHTGTQKTSAGMDDLQNGFEFVASTALGESITVNLPNKQVDTGQEVWQALGGAATGALAFAGVHKIIVRRQYNNHAKQGYRQVWG